MIRKPARILLILTILLLALFTSACQPSWHVMVTDQTGSIGEITYQDVKFYIDKSTEPADSVPLAQLLYHNGYTLVETISFMMPNGEEQAFVWDEIAASAQIGVSGEIWIGNEAYEPDQIHLKLADPAATIKLSIIDIAPTIAYVLGLPELEDSTGEIQITTKDEWEYAVMILLDGLQYGTLENAVNTGKLPFFQQIGVPEKGLSVYPPITLSASAAILTGTPPQVNGVYGYGYRDTTQTTLFDLAVGAGKSVTAIEGVSLPFNLRNAKTTLSGDKDGNGFSDDNVFQNSLEIIQNKLPDLLYIHFHEIDDMGHSYGPDSIQYLSALQRVDGYLEHIIDALPEKTFIAVFADHGMHETTNGGNHGTLTEEDLVVPIIFLEK